MTAFRPKEPDIDHEDPFAGDLMGRGDLADALTSVVTNTPGPLVLNVNGEWGSGKTYFLKRWKACLDRVPHPNIYLNIWEHEYTHTPLASLIGEMSEALGTFAIDRGKKRAARIQINRAKELAGALVRNTQHFKGRSIPGEARDQRHACPLPM